MNERYDVCIIGGGAAGMMAALGASENGGNVILIERNEKLGKKLYLTGKGRCNITNACDRDEFLSHIVSNSRSMYSSINRFSNRDVMDLFTRKGLDLKIERGGRVFPVSDKSSDVIRTLEKTLKEQGVRIMLNTRVLELILDRDQHICKGVKLFNGDNIYAGRTIVATGGLSYPSTGSTGDGYAFANDAGIEVTKRYPSLVPFNIKGDICKRLMGLSLKNCGIRVTLGNKVVYKDFGELLFTHFGVSGPLILTASSQIEPGMYRKGLKLHMDLKPALSRDELDTRILRDFELFCNKEFRNSLSKLLPSKMIPVIVSLSGIDPDKRVNEISRKERERLLSLIKDFELEILSTRGFDEAIITKGGIAMREIDPKTFASKKIEGLFFAGEVLDLDAHTGGYNLQIAWSSGYAAGSAV